MNMVGQAGAGTSVDIEADVVTMRTNGLVEYFLGVAGKEHYFQENVFVEGVDVGDMVSWCDEQVARGIGESIEYGQGVLGAPEYEIFSIFVGNFVVFTEKTLFMRGCFLGFAPIVVFQ